MKTIITTSLLGAMAFALPAAADQAIECTKTQACVKTSFGVDSSLIQQVSEKITAKPEQAGEVVKAAILQSKANAELVLQIVKAAVIAAPDQAEVIRKVALALAPETDEEVQIVIASVLQGDQVAATFNASDAANAARDKNKNASNEPEGRQPKKNTVWLTNWGALFEGHINANSLPSKVQDTGISPNVNHNQGANVFGGTTVIIRPPVTPPVTTLP